MINDPLRNIGAGCSPIEPAYTIIRPKWMTDKEWEYAKIRLSTPPKETEINLNNGDALKILPESKEFRFKCCDCGLVHLIKIEREGMNILLKFYRE